MHVLVSGGPRSSASDAHLTFRMGDPRPLHGKLVIERTRPHEPDLVGDIMTRRLVSVSVGATALDAKRVLRDEGIHHLLVSTSEEVAGVLCSCDLLSVEPSCHLIWLVSRRVLTIGPRTSISAAAGIMRSTGVGCLPIEDDHHIRGIVTRGDLHRSGLAPEATGVVCAGCGSHHHVRRALPPSGAIGERRACLDCLERAASPHMDDPYLDLGGEA